MWFFPNKNVKKLAIAWILAFISVSVWLPDLQRGKHSKEYFLEKSFLENFGDSA